MIPGVVTSKLEATVRFHILGANGQSQAIDAIVDTGFEGFLSLPSVTVASLGLPWIYQDRTELIDARTIPIDIHSAVVIWNGKLRSIDVQALGGCNLIGMRLLAGHDLAIRVTDGGAVSIDGIP
ncbi:MAG: clan AA aspartic protease [Planctomycetes bacterium]|nr:clan AA aspartic protease [Planctomycetota bacterium]